MNVVALGVTVAMFIPVYLAQRIAGGDDTAARPTRPMRGDPR